MMNEWKRQRSPQIQQCNFSISQHKLCLSLNASMASLTGEEKKTFKGSTFTPCKVEKKNRSIRGEKDFQFVITAEETFYGP